MKSSVIFAVAALSLGLAGGIARAQSDAPASLQASLPSSLPSSLYVTRVYDPRVDPARDLARAIERAQAEDKRILLVVGGDWCVWCEILDRFLAATPEVRSEFAQSFLIVKVFIGEENENTAFLAAYPSSNRGYPDFLILNADGSYLGAQDTALLESGRSYSSQRMIAFARRWRVAR